MLDDYGTVLGETKAIEEFQKKGLNPKFKKIKMPYFDLHNKKIDVFLCK